MLKQSERAVDGDHVQAQPTGYRMFTEAQLDEIHLASLEILRRTGVRVYEAQALTLLQEQRMYLEGHRTYYGTGSDLPNTLDLETGERRPSLLSDVQDLARLADSLPNLDFVMSMALPSDVPVETSDRRSFLAMIENTTKPVVFTAWDEAGLADIIAMAETIAGGADELALKPFLLAYLEPSHQPLSPPRAAWPWPTPRC
jgi:trimethylamine--corrinoid protein Co-methyltransferase